MATGRISWAEAAPAGARGRISWVSVDAQGHFGRISWVEVTEAAVSVKGRISWAEATGGAAPATVYTLTAEAGAYTMTWAGSTGQMVLEAEAGAYLMAEQPATLTVIFDVTSPTINTGDNLRFLKDRNRRPVLFPD